MGIGDFLKFVRLPHTKSSTVPPLRKSWLRRWLELIYRFIIFFRWRNCWMVKGRPTLLNNFRTKQKSFAREYIRHFCARTELEVATLVTSKMYQMTETSYKLALKKNLVYEYCHQGFADSSSSFSNLVRTSNLLLSVANIYSWIFTGFRCARKCQNWRWSSYHNCPI